MSRRHNLRRLKRHQAYTAGDLAKVLKINIGTVRHWCKEGLLPIDQRRPYLFMGEHVSTWLAARMKPHRSLAPGELLCLCCKTGRLPRNRELSLIPRSPTTMDFHGLCEVCERPLFRRVRIAEIPEKLGPCRLAYEDGQATVKSVADSLQTGSFVELSA